MILNIGSGNGMLPDGTNVANVDPDLSHNLTSGNKTLPKPMLIQIYVPNSVTRPQWVKVVECFCLDFGVNIKMLPVYDSVT